MMTEPQKEWVELWRLTDEVVKEIERYVYRVDDRPVKLTYKPLDQIRLLKLVVWARRYSITVEQLLDMVVPVFRSQMPNRKSHGLGIRISTLVSEGSERILGEELIKKYPNGENITGWKHEERIRQLDRERAEDGIITAVPAKILEYQSVRGFVEQYRKASEATRDTYRAAVNSQRRRNKPYRGNPWR